jgi:hypothetical protein
VICWWKHFDRLLWECGVGTESDLYRGNDNCFRRVELPSFLGSVHVLSNLRDRVHSAFTPRGATGKN